RRLGNELARLQPGARCLVAGIERSEGRFPDVSAGGDRGGAARQPRAGQFQVRHFREGSHAELVKKNVAILLWATDPGQPHLCGTPFFHAAAAGAMGAEVEMYFTSKSVRLLEKGVAERLYPGPARDRTIGEYMAHAL